MSAIATALRNASVLAWWSATQPGFRTSARAQFVATMGWPDCELGTMDEWAQDPDVIDWLAATCADTLAAFADDQL